MRSSLIGCGADGAAARRRGFRRLGERQGGPESAREGQGAEAREPGFHPWSFRFRKWRATPRAARSRSAARPPSESAPSFHIRARNPTAFSSAHSAPRFARLRRGQAARRRAASLARRRDARRRARRRSGRAEPPAPAIAMHGAPALPAGFRRASLCRPGRAEGRQAAARLSRDFRQPQSVQRQGALDRRRARRPRVSDPDGAFARRAVHALRPHRRNPSKPTPPATTRPSGSTRGRISPTASPITAEDVRFSFELLRDQGTAAAARGFRAWSNRWRRPDAADDPLRPRRRRRPRTAADPGAHAGAVAPAHRRRAFRGSDPRNSRRLRPLCRRQRRPRPPPDVYRRDPNYWAQGPRRSRAGSTISTRSTSNISRTRPRCSPHSPPASTMCGSRTTRRAGATATISRRAGAATSSSRRCRSDCRRACPASPSTRGAPCSPTFACARRWPRCSTSNGSTRRCSPAPSRAP